MVRFLTILISISFIHCAYGQESSIWDGILTRPLLKDTLPIHLSITEENGYISGISKTTGPRLNDSCVCSFSGRIEGESFVLIPSRILKKHGPCCLSNFRLNLFNESNLVGNWHGDLKLNTCPPGVNGIIALTRTDLKPNLQDSPISIDSIPQDDLLIALKRKVIERGQYALIIGNNEYVDENLNDLSFPVSNALSLKNALINNYHFIDSNIIFIKNGTRKDIIKGFEEMMTVSRPESQVLIFYGGHGTWDAKLKQGYWIPSDASLNSHENWISNSTILDYINGIPSKHTLVISDACFSGAIFRTRDLQTLKGHAAIELYNLRSKKAITSGSMSTVPDNSIFMNSTLKKLSLNKSLVFSADQLFNSVKFEVIQLSPNGQIPQFAPIKHSSDEGGSLMFVH